MSSGGATRQFRVQYAADYIASHAVVHPVLGRAPDPFARPAAQPRRKRTTGTDLPLKPVSALELVAQGVEVVHCAGLEEAGCGPQT